MIIEIAGRPPEHIKEALKTHILQFKEYKEVTLMSESFSDPKKIDGSHDMYTCFSEVEFEVESFSRLMDIVFDFMPASIEILNPSQLEINVSDATSFLNTLAGRLHKYDELTGIAQIQAKQLAEKLKEIYEKGLPQGKNAIAINTNIESSGILGEEKNKDKNKKKSKKKI